ncbi:MAG: DUF4097 family beta strand repeat protein [Bacteroidetes bacterium]|nr:DUF4097 family beta strand repeat protein [Bacteroidota bacterium]
MNSTAILRLTLFALLTIVFVSGLIAYSNSRGHQPETSDIVTAEDLGASVAGSDRARKYERNFAVKDGGHVVVEADAGEVTIEPWDKQEVNITVEIIGSDSRSEKYKVEFSQEGNTVKVTGSLGKKKFFNWNVGDLEVIYTINTPRTFDASVNTSGGDISVKGLAGRMELNTSGGNVTAESVTGNVDLTTSGGDVEANTITGDVFAETSGGDVRVESVTGNVKANTSGGNVSILDTDGTVKGGTSGGDVRISLRNDVKGVDVETSGGSIEIALKEGLGADIEAETSGGSVDCDFPVTVRGKVRESELHGRINGGGNSIRASTTGGDIRIVAVK